MIKDVAFLFYQNLQQFYFLGFVNRMSSIKNGRSADQIETDLNRTIQRMLELQDKGEYVEAEDLRIKSEQLKKQYEKRRLYEMELRHRDEDQQLAKMHQNQFVSLKKEWDNNIGNHNSEGNKLVKEMELRHQNELETKRHQLEVQLPLKVKESTECLNLRKMEEHMAKQRNYVEAHKIQQKIAELEVLEKQKWMSNRDNKMNTALNSLKAKQEVEVANLRKKIRTGQDEMNKQSKKEEEKLHLKYQHIRREQKMQQDKEKIAFKGQFTSKGGQGSPMLTKTKLFSSRC